MSPIIAISLLHLVGFNFLPPLLGLKLSPVKKQIHRIDVKNENKLLVSVFDEAYAFYHFERTKAGDGVNAEKLIIVSHKLESSIERWSMIENKLSRSISGSNSTVSLKQAIFYEIIMSFYFSNFFYGFFSITMKPIIV